MTDVLLIVSLLLLVVVLALQLLSLKRRMFTGSEAMQLSIEAMRRAHEQALADVRQDIARCTDAVDAAARRVQEHVSASLRDVSAALGAAGSNGPEPGSSTPAPAPAPADLE